MTTTNFRFAHEILRRLGEELNPSVESGIVELVKNAYDANAKNCSVEFVGTDQPGGAVVIEDDGDGMGEREIVEGWLVVGRSSKRPTEPTRLGRIPAGNKGLGRLAALRLGDRVALTTRPVQQPKVEYRIAIDWGKFEGEGVVEDVPLEVQSNALQTHHPPGTRIHIQNINNRVGRVAVKRLARAMVLLADPFGDDPTGFLPRLKHNEFDDLVRLVEGRYFDMADFHLRADIDGTGFGRATVSDWRGRELFQVGHAELKSNDPATPYRCPHASFDLWAFILNKEAFSTRPVSLAEVRAWLSEFGGVHLYENGLRVSPYGNEGNDWLDMNLRRVQSPEERPSTNNSIGRVSVRDTAGLLVQKTDRAGFIETSAFSELRNFAKDALEWMARRRLSVAESRRQRARRSSSKSATRAEKKVDAAIDELPPEHLSTVRTAYNAYVSVRDRETSILRNEVQLYRTLSTAGILVATFAHESHGNPLKVIDLTISSIERRIKRGGADAAFNDKWAEQIKRVRDASAALSVLGSATLGMLDNEKRRAGRVDIHAVVRWTFKALHPFLAGRDVTVIDRLCDATPYLLGTEAAVESICSNLINNALGAFEAAATKDRTICVESDVEGDFLVLLFMDSGPGLVGIERRSIWLPGRTTRPNGTGLGLTIVKDSVVDLGGSISAEASSKIGGALFRLEFPLIGR